MEGSGETCGEISADCFRFSPNKTGIGQGMQIIVHWSGAESKATSGKPQSVASGMPAFATGFYAL